MQLSVDTINQRHYFLPMSLLKAKYTEGKTRIITYLSILFLIAIFSSLVYIVTDYYAIVRYSLQKEINSVLEESYHAEFNMRFKSKAKGSPLTVIPPPPTPQNSVVHNLDKMGVKGMFRMRTMSIAIDLTLSKKIPMNIHHLDSIVSEVLANRKINSEYLIQVINPKTGKILKASGKQYNSSSLLIYSEPFAIDFLGEKSLRLILVNPFNNIFERMGTLLVISFLLAMGCLYGLWTLFRIQSRQKKLMEVKNDFFGNTAHELKRPVAQLHLALEALSKPSVFDNVEKRDRYLTISKAATMDMTQKINMIMTLSMAEEGVFKLNYSHFNLYEEVLKLIEQFSAVAGKEIEIRIDAKDHNVTVNADKEHMCQCIANLIDNAIKYSGVSVAITISLQKMEDALRVSVSDNGIGIDSEKIHRIFDKYFRVNAGDGMPDGFGIGLSYVKAVIEKHDGHIEVSSERQLGSEFSLYLPV